MEFAAVALYNVQNVIIEEIETILLLLTSMHVCLFLC
jgi:hypothetical protein